LERLHKKKKYKQPEEEKQPEKPKENEEKVHKCGECPFTTKVWRSLGKHMKRAHGLNCKKCSGAQVASIL
jgi:hypothetical protein